MSVSFVNFRGIVTYEELARTDWASATFSGERHRIQIALEGPGTQATVGGFLDGLDDREFDLQDHILIDIAAVVCTGGPDSARIELEALTVAAD